MIKYHPTGELLNAHCAGELPLSLATAISAHCEMCPDCQAQSQTITAQIAACTLGDDLNSALAQNNNKTPTNPADAVFDTKLNDDLNQILEQITSKPISDSHPVTSAVKIKVPGHGLSTLLPNAFRQQLHGNWKTIGKVSRLRLALDEGNTRASLLHIDKHGEVPQHTHKGQEITLLLEGEFSDGHSQYVAGDFIIMNNNHEHAPKTATGCLCYTVVDAPLHFTKGISQLLNPIGKLIY